MRKVQAAGALVAGLLLAVGGVASAQSPPADGSGPPRKYKAQPLILQKEKLGTDAFAQVGRSRLRNGDCQGALEAFDSAIRTSIDPTLYRDRGLCHERLGHPYPAIDDYRFYLTAEPDAPDAEGIRGRLARLEQDTTGRSSGGADVPGDDAHPGAAATVSIDAGGAHAGASTSPGKARDKMEYVEHDDDQMNTPLRRGKGWAFAPFFALHKWYSSNEKDFGDSATWSESVGLQFRYSTGHSGAVFAEAGYEHFNDTQLSTTQGLTSQIGYEFRFPLDPDYDNQFFFAPGLGFEYVVFSPKVSGFSSINGFLFVPRARFGYRRMIDTSAAIDLSLDAGIAPSALGGGDLYSGPASTTAVLMAANLALVWGL